MTTLTHSACFPSHIQRQNVSLVLQVISEKTAAALALKGKAETAELVGAIVRLWKILNVKCPNLHIRLNDIDRQQITSKFHQSLVYMKNFASSVKEMRGGRGVNRVRSLTNETRDALFQTLNGLRDMACSLLEDTSMHFNMFCLEFFKMTDLKVNSEYSGR